jgi:DNA mismatch endonuclease, patch repair protein
LSKDRPYKIYDAEKIKVPRFEEAAGFYATAKSSAIMSRIRAQNNKAELMLRKALWSYGYRYRLYSKKVMGKPDIIFSKHRLVIFVDGDFWHGYDWENKQKKLATNKGFWIPKIERNMQRDMEVNQTLLRQGWTVIRFWEHEVKNSLEGCVGEVLMKLKNLETGL